MIPALLFLAVAAGLAALAVLDAIEKHERSTRVLRGPWRM